MPAQDANYNRPAAVAKTLRKTRPAPKTQPGPISDAENNQIDRHKRSRSYYNAYKGGFQQNAKVKKATKRMERGLESGNKRLVLTAKAALEHEHRRGPDKIAGDAYRHYALTLWRRAKRYYPGSDAAPKVKIGYDGPKNAFAWANKGENTVYYSPSAIRSYMGPKPFRKVSKSVPLHEFTHLRQSDRTLANVRLREGAAEVKGGRVGKKLGIPYAYSDAYRKYTKRARRKPRFVNHGQFK